ncbi:MAG: pyridoxine 5'-phosphate synthase [Bacteroidota bacterium]|jgi:pyridoxine 5-phosphate synthase|nr:pyridoxine 5'-phosphate synthase [Bacteroidota bacterium]MCA6442638.1 pyridoxine 5'-phosphate synthase [Bacteroidota bacterium]
MTKLSVNINKIATLRNARGHNVPDVIEAAINIERFGAQGITVHPRPDERHITYKDVVELKKVVTTEFNIEGNPKEKKFVDLVLSVNPTQVTLVPDAQNQLTSNHGWDTILNQSYLKDIIKLFKDEGIRTSIFVDPVESMVAAAKDTGTDRIELYTESYASLYEQNKTEAIKPFVNAAILAEKLKLGLNAGHDLNLKNLKYFKQSITCLSEVSIGHALISDSLYLGLENTVQLYRRELM